jgi:hypothetical protein
MYIANALAWVSDCMRTAFNNTHITTRPAWLSTKLWFGQHMLLLYVCEFVGCGGAGAGALVVTGSTTATLHLI